MHTVGCAAGIGTPLCARAKSRSTSSNAPSAKRRVLCRRCRLRPQPPSGPEPEKPVADDEDRTDSKIANKSIRVSVDTLENLMTMVSELVLTRNQLLDIVRRHDDSEFKVPLQRLSNVTAELQDGVMRTRMQPIGNAWQKLPRIVRDLGAELGKDIELEMHGADTELDRQVLERIKDPLTHMVRNSADHGLESIRARIAAGKPEKGTIRLSAYHEGGHIIIGVADDGRGLDTERIKAKALASGLASEAELEKMSEPQIQKFIFTPGFSTAPRSPACPAAASAWTWCATISIRSAAASTCNRCRGRGLSFTIKIPLTLAIISALIVEAGGERFAIPQLSVIELVRVHAKSEHRIERIKDAAVLRLAQQAVAAGAPEQPVEAWTATQGDPGQGLHRRDTGRRTDLRHRGRQRVPHRGNRGQADGDASCATSACSPATPFSATAR